MIWWTSGTALLLSKCDIGAGSDSFSVWAFNGFQSYFDQTWISNLSGDSGHDDVSALSAVPEPNAALLGSFGLLALLRRRRA